MNEITDLTLPMADQSDAFLDGLDDTSAEADQLEAEDVSAEEDELLPAETHGETQDSSPRPGDAGSVHAPAWTVRHLGEERTLQAGDVTPELLQKGLDYDRVRSKYDEAKPVLEMLSQFAGKVGMDLPSYSRYLRAQAKEADGMSPADAQRAIALEDREAAVAAAEAAQQESRAAGIRADLDNFAAAFPEIYSRAKLDPKVIPQSVWDAVGSGRMSLTAAYTRYAMSEASAAAGNRGNAARSTGSMRSAGSDTACNDPFLAGLEG